MKTSSVFLYYCLGFAWNVFLIYFLSTLSRKGEKKSSDVLAYGGLWRFLTVLNLVLQAVFNGVSLLVDAFVLMKQQQIAKSMFPFRDLLYAGLAFPVSTHTVIFPLVLVDLFITPHHYPSKGKGLSLLGIASSAYLCWILWIYSVTGKWVYPVFEALSPLAIAAFFFGSAALLLFIYNTGEFLCHMIWGDSIVRLDVYRSKSK
ncbi:androgen-dependent TFPI-regulating protein isoform X2 [Rhineura floridana]|uniref:androgen-dependent TFPI-regulating protein isoform X2 n=1 Tax=Rhineura floridana TaxID=261503 RepID=UPI002AC7EF8A|nr:androgen-dependent TFPI-regulating protein isoform X2 [Rhineura floridana]